MASLSPVDRTLTSRFERKYLLDPGMLPEIRSWLSPHMGHDPFSAKCPDHRYSVCSLYLDNENLNLYHQTKNAEKNRFKLRARTYGDNINDPVFFEIKKRMDQIVRKDRVTIARDKALKYIESLSSYAPSETDLGDTNFLRFVQSVEKTQSRPILLVRYMREAFESRTIDPVRVTFDSELQTQLAPDGKITHCEGEWTPVDVPGIILEIKYSDRFPSWIQSLVNSFGLRYTSVPKYGYCVEASPSLAAQAV
ncbi:MAG TPA: polyphosphate polymerase domain-containing protein [Planctomycetota bacterium]|nr:hypothetical protein [Planctomycetota bacterium]MDP7246293.1 polyphosphate polymerase domain-containing protein [Planctomycetota bacterium]HJM38682.1 polyphosphate polymerase domain-containing protein [Planctomycetota bacterium]